MTFSLPIGTHNHNTITMSAHVFTNNKLMLLGVFFLFLLRASLPSTTPSSTAYTVRPLSTTVHPYASSAKPPDIQTLVHAYLSHSPNPITSLYNERLTRQAVKDFFINKTGSEEITNTVLFNAENQNMPLDIVFSLVFVESSFKPRAVNVNANQSQDMGLFQLNTNTFRHMRKQDFFHLDTNAKAGIGYLKYAFGLDPDPKIALAIYNAGPSRPLRGLIPISTQKYTARILAYSKKLNNEFAYYMRKRFAAYGDIQETAKTAVKSKTDTDNNRS